MAENMEEEKVFIKEEISTEDTSTVYLKEDDVKVEITEIQGKLLVNYCLANIIVYLFNLFFKKTFVVYARYIFSSANMYLESRKMLKILCFFHGL